MKLPPTYLDSWDLRAKLSLLAFVPHEELYDAAAHGEHFFLAIYCKPDRQNEFYIVLVNESGTQQRRFTPAGDSVEFALLVLAAHFDVSPLRVRSFLVYCPVRLFKGHLSIPEAAYRGQLFHAKTVLERLRYQAG